MSEAAAMESPQAEASSNLIATTGGVRGARGESLGVTIEEADSSTSTLEKMEIDEDDDDEEEEVEEAEAAAAAALDNGNVASFSREGFKLKIKEYPERVEAVTPGKAKTEQETNPYAYLEREEFSSERYKIELKGLPKFYGYSQLRKLLNDKLKLNAHKIKPPRMGSAFIFINFRSEDDRDHAISVLDGYTWKNKVLTAVVAKAAQDPLIRKRTHEELDTDKPAELKEPVADLVRNVTIPWWDVPYDKQLEQKMEVVNTIVSDMTVSLYDVNAAIEKTGDIICPVENIKASPVIVGYRNKCEFTIGVNPETLERTVGFRLASYRLGSVSVGPIDDLIHLPKRMIEGAIAFQTYVRESELKPYDPETHTGCWKQLTVRTTSDGQLLLMVIVSARELEFEDVRKLRIHLKETFSPMTEPKISSFYFKVAEKHGQLNKNLPDLVFGDKCITQQLLGLNFRISPEAFFQINALAAEVLYSTISTISEVDEDTTVIDVCCGTGTIGLCVAQKCGQVLGIEMGTSAVIDAKENARYNELSDKCEFFAGKAETLLDAIIPKAKFGKIVAIVDPPRAGLHQRVLLSLRKCEKIRTLIYVACDARAAMKNFIDLARPISKSYKGTPFVPKTIIPVDLFPNSHYFELIIIFERIPTRNSRVRMGENSSAN